MADYKGIDYLRRKLEIKRPRVQLRYKYYDMKQLTRDLGVSTPEYMRGINAVLGWCGTAVDALADRIEYRSVENDIFDIQGVFNKNNPDVFFDSAVKGALISSCDFVYIAPREDGFPRLQVVDGGNATGIIDPITNLLIEGYAVLKRDQDTTLPIQEAYFLPNLTIYYENGSIVDSYEHKVEYPLLVPIINRPDAARPFGHSRITRACMELTNEAVRTLKRSELTAEFYSFPQKYATGLDPEGEKLEKWRATISTLLTFTKDADGQSPTLGQFQQASQAPHLEQFKLLTSAFAGETNLTPDDLGFPGVNPSSSEAIKASHETLRLKAHKAQRSFGSGLLNVGFLSACLRDEFMYKREVFYNTKILWEPAFAPDAAELAGIGDAVIKIQQAFPDYFTADKLRDLTGI